MFSNSEGLAMSYSMALWSPDSSNQNGAIVCQGGVILSVGYNHFYKGVPPTQERPAKYDRIVHAEADSCLALSKSHVVVDSDTKMFCAWATCKQCALAILGSGIPKLVIHYDRCRAFAQSRAEQNGESLQDWQPDIDESSQWLKNGGCEIEVFEGPVDFNHTIKINGRHWSPKELCFAD